MPIMPSISDDELDGATFTFLDADLWIPAPDLRTILRSRLDDMRSAEVPTVEEVSHETSAELERLNEQYVTHRGRGGALRAGARRSAANR